mmetsp:Transcript_58132/g.156236  ORF Transcript_58132/g.156236 Transcript_58132/m.156236 type:complete len:470 (+) Transcript_58132:151-1560(+)
MSPEGGKRAQPTTSRLQLFFLVALAVLPGSLPQTVSTSEEVPRLDVFEVFGLLPSNKQLQVPFDPPFNTKDIDLQDFVCKLDHSMEYFSVIINARSPGVLSKLDLDGKPVLSRANLTRSRLAAGARMVFDIGVTDQTTRRFTLVVERRKGSSLELLGLRPVTAIGHNFTAPFRSGELQDHFEAEQSFYEDTFVLEYDFADGGQEIQCRIDHHETIGPDAPTRGQMALHPYRYVTSLEQLGRLREEPFFNLNSPGAGPTCRCKLPIDTWRRIDVGLHIRAADQVSHRDIRITLTRKGCAPDTFYHQGACLEHCPTFFYPQSFNWRCGKCNRHCEFCEHWHHCLRCERNTTMYTYELRGEGTCEQVRVHAYKVYYELARYLAAGCVALVALYAFVCAACVCRRALQTEGGGGANGGSGGGAGGRRRVLGGGYGGSVDEERQPLTAAMSMNGSGRASIGAGGLLRGHGGPAE